MPPALTLRQFLRYPSHEDWMREIDAGWSGANGSSASTDAICGVRIGIKSGSYKKNLAPDGRLYAASWHDYLYHLGRKWDLPIWYCQPADAIYRDRCLIHVAHLVGPFGAWADARCYGRYAFLRGRCYLRASVGIKPWGSGN